MMMIIIKMIVFHSQSLFLAWQQKNRNLKIIFSNNRQSLKIFQKRKMSKEEQESNELTHDIQAWDSNICHHLLPYWQKKILIEHSIPTLSPYTPPFLAISPRSVELIFHTCERLDLPLPVYFLSVDIFDNFVANHVIELFGCIAQTQSDEKGFDMCWEGVKAHISKQMYLRLLSCIQLGSKITFTGQLLTTSQIQELLAMAKQNFDIDSIITSEFRVFKTLGFKIPLYGALDMAEQLLQECSYLNPELLHPTCGEVLKLCYLQYSTIYSRFSSMIQDNQIAPLLAAGSLIVACRLHCLQERTVSRTIKYVTDCIAIPVQHLLQLVDFVISMVLA